MKMMTEMLRFREMPKVTVITGRAYGAVYIAVAGKTVGSDAVLAWPTAAISPLAPKTAVQLLWTDRLAAMTDPDKERDALTAEYAENECSPMSAESSQLPQPQLQPVPLSSNQNIGPKARRSPLWMENHR